MRVLLDECVPRKLRSELPGHDVKTVADMKWAGTKNGELLQRVASEFDALVTVDQGIPYQQNLAGMAIALVIIQAPEQRYQRPAARAARADTSAVNDSTWTSG